MTTFLIPSAFGTPLFFLLGAVIGSFGNVLLYRLPQGESIGGRSRCPHCKRTLTGTELIPIVSFIMQRGRCRGCRQKISLRYPFVEAATGALFVLALWLTHLQFFVGLSLGIALWLFLLAAVMDAERSVISDAITFPLIAASLLFAVLHDTPSIRPPIAGGVFFALQWIVSGGKGVGSADILIGIAMGVLLPTLPLLLVALMAAYIIGSLVVVACLASKRKKRGDHIPFVPFLALGAIIALVWGHQLLLLYGINA